MPSALDLKLAFYSLYNHPDREGMSTDDCIQALLQVLCQKFTVPSALDLKLAFYSLYNHPDREGMSTDDCIQALLTIIADKGLGGGGEGGGGDSVRSFAFSQNSLSGNTLTLTHGLGRDVFSALLVDNNKRPIEVDYQPLTSNVVQFDMTNLAPITGIWQAIIHV